MTNSLVQRLIEMCCRHEFTWPHAGVHGTAYQACLLCGAVYSYDCNTMQRTGRLVTTADSRYQGTPRKTNRKRVESSSKSQRAITDACVALSGRQRSRGAAQE